MLVSAPTHLDHTPLPNQNRPTTTPTPSPQDGCFQLGDVILAIDGAALAKKRHAMQELLMQLAITNPQSAQPHGTYRFHVLRAGLSEYICRTGAAAYAAGHVLHADPPRGPRGGVLVAGPPGSMAPCVVSRVEGRREHAVQVRPASPVDNESSPRARIMAEAAALQRKHERLDRVRASKERMGLASSTSSSTGAEHWVRAVSAASPTSMDNLDISQDSLTGRESMGV